MTKPVHWRLVPVGSRKAGKFAPLIEHSRGWLYAIIIAIYNQGFIIIVAQTASSEFRLRVRNHTKWPVTEEEIIMRSSLQAVGRDVGRDIWLDWERRDAIWGEYIVLHGIACYCMVLHGIAWYYIVLQAIEWYCMVLHGIAESLLPVKSSSFLFSCHLTAL